MFNGGDIVDFRNPAKVEQKIAGPLYKSRASIPSFRGTKKSNAPWLKVRRRFKTPMFKGMR